MTNTAITDPELLEFRFPVRLERFAIRKGSGGRGVYRGGDGIIRELTFLKPASVSLLTQHRIEAPFGLHGGGEGMRGKQWIEKADGQIIELDSTAAAEVKPGDHLVIETPGGGGCTRSDE